MKCVYLLSALVAVTFLHGCEANDLEPKFMVDRVISQVISQVIHPITLQLNKHAEAIRKLLEEHGVNAADEIHRMLEGIAELIQTPLLQIYKILKDMGLVIRDLESKVMSMLNIFFEKVKDISLDNFNLLTAYVEQLVNMVATKFRSSQMPRSAVALNAQPYFISRIIGAIINKIISPIVGLLNKYLDEARRIVENKVGNIEEALKKQAIIISELLRPYIIRILNILNDMGVSIGNLRNMIKLTLTSLIDNVKGLTKANIEIFKRLLGYILSSLLGGNDSLEGYWTGPVTQSYIISSILRPIIDRLIGPIIDNIKSHIQTILDAVSHHSSNIQAIITEQAKQIAELLRPTMIRLINILNNVGVQISDLRGVIEQTLNLIMDSLGMLVDLNKDLLRDIVAHVVQSLIEALEVEEAYIKNTKIIDIVIKPIIQVVREQLRSIFESITTQGSHLTDAVKQHIQNVANLLRPIISRLIPDTHGNPSAVRRVLDLIFNAIGEVSGVTSDSIKVVMDYLIAVLTGEAVPTVKSLPAL